MTPAKSSMTSARADAQAARIVDELQQVLRRHVPDVRFKAPERSTGRCGDGGSAGITRFHLLIAEGRTPVPDAAWPQVEQEAWAMLQRNGFTERAVMVDAPGRHDMTYGRPDGGRVALGSEQTIAVTVETGCHPEDGSAPTS